VGLDGVPTGLATDEVATKVASRVHPINFVLFEGASSLSRDELDTKAVLDSGDECRGRHDSDCDMNGRSTKPRVAFRNAPLPFTLQSLSR
jgi:hypothetical protein